MAGSSKARRSKASAKNSPTWTTLTWDDLVSWAGSRSVQRGRAYQRQGRVKQLVQHPDGKLLATVSGGDRYTTLVWLTPARSRADRLGSRCTCPVGFSGCKHAVAVVAAYLDAMAQGTSVPAADDDDPRWHRLDGESIADDDDDVDEVDADDESAPIVSSASRRSSPGRRTREQWDDLIRAHLRDKTQQELADLIWSLTERYPELRSEFQERLVLAEGDAGRLLAEARREMRSVTEEIGWQNHWDHQGHTPDYTRLQRRLARLAEMGHCNEVAELGRDLIRRGVQQIEQSHDEGETAMAMGECLATVFDAVKRSDMPAADKIMYAIDAEMLDDYGLVEEASARILDARWTRADWSAVADRLAQQLKTMPPVKDGDFSSRYRRDEVSTWLLRALRHAGRDDELLAVYEDEARRSGSYQRLVDYLLEQGRLDDAQRWALEGLANVPDRQYGVESSLIASLCEIARRRRRWDIVAAHAAAAFITQPSPDGFTKLIAAAKKAKCSEQVHTLARAFLETGVAPFRIVDNKGKLSWTTVPDWPLPMPEYLIKHSVRALAAPEKPQPHYDVLMELAIDQKRPDEVLQWYDKLTATTPASAHHRWSAAVIGRLGYDDRIAQAVAVTHPDRALAIYRRGLDANLPHADPRAYDTCAHYLRKIKPILHALGRDDDWARLLADIRLNYRNRPRFMEILDRFDGHTIVQAQTAARRRS
jgi:uncharacterized Zn finger protein